MKKVIDFILIFLLAFLVVSFFQKDETQQVLTGGVSITSAQKSYSVPASVSLIVKNQTADIISFNSCKDIAINSNAWKIDLSGADVCRDISIESWMTENVVYSHEYSSFEQAGQYFVTANIAEEERLTSFDVENRWAISKLFIGLVYQPILNLMDWLILNLSYSLGWAIIIITIIVRVVLIWPQHKMMVSQKKLQAIQPKIKKIQEEYKWQQAVLGQKLMALYKKEKVNPMWSCGFLLIQMPILFVLYNVIMNIRDYANGYYLYSFVQDFQISEIASNFYWLELFEAYWVQWAILAICVAVIQFIQIKLSLWDKLKNKTEKGAVLEKKKDVEWYAAMMPDPDMMNKVMLYWMPVMVWVFTFTFFAWLGLYWGMSTLFMIFQQLFVNKVVNKEKKQ